MGFFDLDEFTKAAEDCTIMPHPIAEKLSLAAKTSYLGMVVFAALVDDGKLNEKERKAMRETGLALQLPESEIDETVNTVTNMKTNPVTFVKDSLPDLSERDTAMFLYCDMAGAMTVDGSLTDDDKACLSGMAKFLNFTQEDLNFLDEYTSFFPEDKKPEAADVIFKYSAQKLPEGLVSYFTPVLNQVRIPGGQLPLGDNKFCDGRFIIDSQVIVGAGSTLLVKNAEIEFKSNGWIEIADGDAEFIDSKLTVGESKTEKPDEKPMYLIKSSAAMLWLSGCSFDGKMARAAISQDHKLYIENCKFSRLKCPESGVFGGNVTCNLCTFDHCNGYRILDSDGNGKIYKTKFYLCVVNDTIVNGNTIELSIVLYKKCKTNYLWYPKSSPISNMCHIDCAVKKQTLPESDDEETWKKAFEEKEPEESKEGKK